MSDEVVLVDGRLRSVALLSSSFVGRPGDLALYRNAAATVDPPLERLLKDALADPFCAPPIRRLVHGPNASSLQRQDTLPKLLGAIKAGAILAVPIPGASAGAARILLDRPPTDLPVMRRAAPQQEAVCKEVLVEAGKEAEVAASPLLEQAHRVLAAWSVDRRVGPGPAVRAVHAVSQQARRGRTAFLIAAHLLRAAALLARQDKFARDSAIAELRQAARLLAWPELLAVLVHMTPEFRPTGGIGQIETPPPAPTRRAPPPPAAPPPQAPDDTAQADALRVAAESGVPFCIPCALAAAQAGAA